MTMSRQDYEDIGMVIQILWEAEGNTARDYQLLDRIAVGLADVFQARNNSFIPDHFFRYIRREAANGLQS